MRRKLFFALIALAFIAGTANISVAAPNIENTSQVGSLLIFPFIAIEDTFDDPPLPDNVDTFITISNTSKKGVNVKCFWVYCVEPDDPDPDCPDCVGCYKRDFGFYLTAGQPVWFSAKTGQGGVPPNKPSLPVDAIYAELKCWAVSVCGNPIRWNYLMGEATLIDFNFNLAATYPAHSFKAYGVPNNREVGYPGEILLAGLSSVPGADRGYFDACYKYLYFHFFATGSEITSAPGEPQPNPLYPLLTTQANVIAISPCKQDLRQGGLPTRTKLEFDITDENETKYTSISDCLECFWVSELGDLDVRFTSTFPGGLQTDLGRVRVWANGDPLCDKTRLVQDVPVVVNPAVNTGIVGVHVSKFGFSIPGGPIFGGLKATTGFGSTQFRDPDPDRILFDFIVK